MKKILITFGDRKYYGSMKRLENTAREIGKVDEVHQYSQEWLQHTGFWKQNAFILQRPRGAGYWIWKPYILLDAMNLYMEDGDIVMYSDAGVEVIKDLSPLYDLAQEKDRIVFRLAGKHNNKTWTKRDTFVLMGCDEQKYWDAIQTTASYHLWKKTDANIQFLTDYMKFLRDPRIVTDDVNMAGKQNFMEFRDHRHDQSVLSLMTIRDNFERHCDPCQYGNEEREEFDNSPYDQLLNHHRKRL
jgi:hypothetical protein